MKARPLLCGVLVLMMMPLGARGGDRLTMRITPAVAMAPADLIVRTTVEASSENRAIEIIAESNDFYRSSEMPLDGKNAPRTTQFEFRSLPGGVYTVVAVLKGANDEQLARARGKVNLVEGLRSR